MQFELKDAQGNALSGKTVNITYNTNETYTITTDQNGKGYITIVEKMLENMKLKLNSLEMTNITDVVLKIL